MSDDRPSFNGIDGATGEYVSGGLTLAELSRIAQGEKIDASHLAELKLRAQGQQDHYGAIEGVDQADLAQAGWGVVFAHADKDRIEAVQGALAPLLELRRAQAGPLYREYVGVDAYRPGESKPKFLARHGAGPGPVDPERVPYYLLLVASPESIPYRFQYQLDVQYGVGRIHFDDVEDYARYARSVVAAETGGAGRSRSAAFFGVRNADDRATEMSARDMVAPLAETLEADEPDWEVRSLIGDEATKANLGRLLAEEDGPALLFTASHGMSLPMSHPGQVSDQGALICQDWPGPLEWRKPLPPEHYFGGADLEDARPAGLVTIHFACYGAGTPRHDDFAHQAFKERVDIADRPFVARLPQGLLAHPEGGALACIGHVERAWGWSFSWPGAGRQLAVFESALTRLLAGHPVGSAMDYFNERYAELSSDLASELEEVEFGKQADDRELAGMWTANNDARGYVVVGDPAVRLAVD